MIATGVQYSVREFIQWSAEALGISIEFQGVGVDETAIVSRVDGEAAEFLSVGDTIMRIDPRYFRPSEVETLLGDPTKAKEKLGWLPTIGAKEMCLEMIQSDLQVAKRARLLKENGMAIATSSEI